MGEPEDPPTRLERPQVWLADRLATRLLRTPGHVVQAPAQFVWQNLDAVPQLGPNNGANDAHLTISQRLAHCN
ncbi:MAG: hypothetical protein UU04_C0019G0009 [Candidatus Uhrbacteria bacterium GW2011_GWC2_40_450]|nr:MAG: hypothetical protein UU04_C0019G0009 [Candidatus Uhrbacteria bacterium GW2011_GWC2_40_450]